MTRLIYLSVFVCIFVVALVFSLLNLDPVRVYFYRSVFIEMPLAAALTLELLVGVGIGYSVRMFRYLKLKSEYAQLERELEAAIEELNSRH